MSHESDLIESDIEAYLDQHQHKELLRFVAVGSVDDGKSTLIGRLLHDTHGVYEDQLSAVKRATRHDDVEIDFSLFTDGLKAEREQGITIDVAYRYFSTEKRKFIIADTPGHVQYTRNMATGASTANVAIILIDARLGVLQQSRRHAYIASLLGIPHLFVCINKMDLVDYDQATYERLKRDFSEVSGKLSFKDVTFIPISALRGHNVVHGSESMPWYSEAGGKTLLAHLETLPIAQDRNLENFRFPVQFVQRPNLNYRGFAGQIASGSVKRGDDVLVLPSRRKSRVKAIDTFSGEVEQAFAPMSVTVRLEDEVDVSRGDMLVHASDLPEVTQDLRAMLVWMSETALDVGKSYFIKHASQYVRARVDAVAWAMDLETLQQQPAQTLGLNEIGCVQLRTHRPVFFDPYTQNRATGAFVVIDSITNDTVAAGMIVEAGPRAVGGTSEQETQVSTTERERQLGHQAALIELRGDRERARRLAFALERVLFDRGQLAVAVADPEPLAPASAQEVCARLLGLGARVIFVGALEPERTTLSALGARRTRVAVSGDAQALELAVDTKSADLEALALDLIERMAVAGAL